MDYKKILKKHKLKLTISVLLCWVLFSCFLFSSCSITARADFLGSYVDMGNYAIRGLVRDGVYDVGKALGNYYGGSIGSSIVTYGLDYFFGASSSGSDGNKYNYYINNGTTNNYDMTNNYQVMYDYSNNPVINNNNTYNYSFYNPVTNNFNYTNNAYYNYNYSTYYYNIDNSVDYYVTDNTTYVSYYIIDNGTGEEWYYEIYYKLPDGRNSYNLTKEDIWGTYFIYDYAKYESVPEDDGTTLGLWHLDGNLKDDSYWNNSSGVSYSASYVDGVYDGGKKLGTSESDYITLKLDKVSLPSSYTLEWLEYIPDIAYNETTTNSRVLDKTSNTTSSITEYYYSNNYTVTKQNYSGVCGVNGSEKWDSNSIPRDSFTPMALVCNGGSYTLYANGNNIDTSVGFIGGGLSISSNAITFNVENILSKDYGWNSYGDYYSSDYHTAGSLMFFYYDRNRTRTLIKYLCNYNCIIDEVRLSKGVLYNSNYVPTTQAFTTNTVLVPPEDVKENEIAFMTNYDISNVRIGGVKPTYPSNGYVYVYLEDEVVKSIQQYQTTGWYEIDASIYKDGGWSALKETDISFLKVVSPDEKEFTVTYKDGNAVFSTSTYTMGTEISAISCNNKHYNKIFKGWDTDISADEVVYSSGEKFNVLGDMVLYAVWEDASINVELRYMDGATPYKVETYVKGSTVTITVCDNDYHNGTFTGWDVLKSAEQAVYFEGSTITIDKDISLYAVWDNEDDGSDISGLTLTYMDGGMIYKKESLEASGNIEISDCTNTHYNSVFKGWAIDSTSEEPDFLPDDSLMLSSDTILYAVWEKTAPDLILTYMDGGLVYSKKFCSFGETVILEGCTNTRHDAVFKGWDINSSSSYARYSSGSSLQITEDTVLYAVWGDSPSPDKPDNNNKPDDSDDTSDGSWDGIMSLVKKISGLITGLFEAILQGISSLISGAVDMLNSLTNSVGVFSSFLSAMFGFVPSEFWTAVTTGFTLIIAIAVIKFLRG